MAKSVGVYTPETAEMVLRVINELVRMGYVTKAGMNGETRWQQNFVTYATAGGGITSGSSASCVMKRFGSGGLETVKTNAGGSQSITVHNGFSNDVEPGALIVAGWSFGKWIVIAEDCPEP